MKQLCMKVLALLIIVLCFVGCESKTDPLVCEYDLSGGPYVVKHAESADISLMVNNTNTYDSLITETIDIHRFAQTFGKNFVGGGNIQEVASDMGISCLRETPEGALYSIHKVEQGGLLYLFYHNNAETINSTNTTVMSWFYVCENVSYEDYTETLVKGKSTMEDVIKLDASEQIFKNYYVSDREYWDNGEGYFYSWHYLKDGILHIRYRVLEDALVVDSFELQEEFQLHDPDEGSSYPYCARLLEQDFIN